MMEVPTGLVFCIPFIMVTTFSVVNLLAGLIVSTIQKIGGRDGVDQPALHRDALTHRLNRTKDTLAKLNVKSDRSKQGLAIYLPGAGFILLPPQFQPFAPSIPDVAPPGVDYGILDHVSTGKDRDQPHRVLAYAGSVVRIRKRLNQAAPVVQAHVPLPAAIHHQFRIKHLRKQLCVMCAGIPPQNQGDADVDFSQQDT